MRRLALLLLAPLISAVEDRPIPTRATLEPAQAIYRSQVLGDCDHAVGERIAFGGHDIATRRGAKGELELDLAGDGTFHAYARSQVVQVTVEIPAGPGKKPKTSRLALHLERHDDGSWTYRNASQLSVPLGEERLVLVDVDGDGSFATPGVDGMTWNGGTWLFPLPKADERFCTATLDLTGLAVGPLGEGIAVSGRPLATTVAAALPVLQGVNRERVALGLTPRPEDVALSADLQQHCAYMRLNDVLTHPEQVGKPGYSPAGNAAGMRSILSQGTPADRLAAMMVETYFHRQDVIRPETLAFGVGYDGRYGGIDGRSSMGPTAAYRWPVLCPVPDQQEVPVAYQREAPDATPGDDRAGYPITAYFGSGDTILGSWRLVDVAAPTLPIDCYPFDRKTGASAEFSGFQHCVCIIPREPLKPAATYEVTLAATHDGKPWSRTWRFAMAKEAKRRR